MNNDTIILDGLKMEIIDRFSSYILTHLKSDNMYLILKKEFPSGEYTIINNLHDDYFTAIREFDRIKEGEN